ncbi:uncharacterized protein LOC115621895 isoform X2 [Scaptodrosophila lebanonensis]|uniref:Uncharacterized protein LOC115621895 isoform X2 n=1 Tax=Drosophila lebanonensis TaxID=7225 RepID=A0A6J2T8G7_DROLE|nr:uncharacterized protein LOC115621895 isoform X2 [Scaptodrosophila lebanonensis]
MFLNEFWQPLILSERPYTIHDQHNGPLLLTSSAFKKRILYPENWNGIVMGSEAAIEEYHTLIREVEGSGHLQLFPLKENAPLVITEEKGYVEVTLIPAGKNEIGHDLHYFLLRSKRHTHT